MKRQHLPLVRGVRMDIGQKLSAKRRIITRAVPTRVYPLNLMLKCGKVTVEILNLISVLMVIISITKVRTAYLRQIFQITVEGCKKMKKTVQNANPLSTLTVVIAN